jgi:large subunit ribosomal protein L23
MSLLSFTKKKAKQPSAKKKAPGKVKAAKKVKDDSEAKNILVAGIDLRPLVTEKSVLLQEGNVVAFRVDKKATKKEIALAVREKYSVEPRKIRTIHMMPKKRRRGHTVGKTIAWKKAYVKVDDVQALKLGP